MNSRKLTMKATRFALSAIAAVAILSVIASAQTKLTYSQAKMAHPDWVQAPGELIRPDCVHEIPNGAMIEAGSDGQPSGDISLNGVRIAHYDACPEAPIVTRALGRSKDLEHDPGTQNGWVEGSQWLVSLGSGDNVDLQDGFWTVPTNPLDDGALIYLFNGIEPGDFSAILQPVLQYGSNGAFGGNYWVIASWYVGPSGFHSGPETVNPGDQLYGYTQITGDSGGTLSWKVDAQDKTTGAFSYITLQNSGEQWTWALAGILEVYSVSNCNQLPADKKVSFTKSYAYHGYPKYDKLTPSEWSAMYWQNTGPACKYSVTAGTTSTLRW